MLVAEISLKSLNTKVFNFMSFLKDSDNSFPMASKVMTEINLLYIAVIIQK